MPFEISCDLAYEPTLDPADTLAQTTAKLARGCLVFGVPAAAASLGDCVAQVPLGTSAAGAPSISDATVGRAHRQHAVA